MTGLRGLRIAALVIAGLVGLGGFLIVPRAGNLLVVSEGVSVSDATLLTYSVNSFARPIARLLALDAAADRYISGDAPRVLISVFRSQDEEFRTQSALATRHLLRRGVASDAIELLPDVTSEHEEGQAVRTAVEGRGWSRVAVLASDFRSRRTAGTLRRALSDTGVAVLMLSVGDPALDLQRWWQTRDGIDAVAGEYLRLAYYFAAGRL